MASLRAATEVLAEVAVHLGFPADGALFFVSLARVIERAISMGLLECTAAGNNDIAKLRLIAAQLGVSTAIDAMIPGAAPKHDTPDAAASAASAAMVTPVAPTAPPPAAAAAPDGAAASSVSAALAHAAVAAPSSAGAGTAPAVAPSAPLAPTAPPALTAPPAPSAPSASVDGSASAAAAAAAAALVHAAVSSIVVQWPAVSRAVAASAPASAAAAPTGTCPAAPSSAVVAPLAPLGGAEVASTADTLLGSDLNDALRSQTLTLGQLRRAIAAALGTTDARLKDDEAITALLKDKMVSFFATLPKASSALAALTRADPSTTPSAAAPPAATSRASGAGATSASAALAHSASGASSSSSAFPAEWSAFGDEGSPQDFAWERRWQLVALEPSSHELAGVTRQFCESMQNVVVVRVERVQHRQLWRRYAAKREEIRRKCAGIGVDDHADVRLWHGTGSTDPRTILRSESGLDERLSSKGFYGKGVYLAEHARYSNGGTEVPMV